MSLVLMASSYRWSAFWNVSRIPASDDMDSIAFAHSVVGYLVVGNYSVESAIAVPMRLNIDQIKGEHDAFRFSKTSAEYGFRSAFLRKNTKHASSSYYSINYLLPACLSAAIFSLLYVSGRNRTQPAEQNGAGQSAAAPQLKSN